MLVITSLVPRLSPRKTGMVSFLTTYIIMCSRGDQSKDDCISLPSAGNTTLALSLWHQRAPKDFLGV